VIALITAAARKPDPARKPHWNPGAHLRNISPIRFANPGVPSTNELRRLDLGDARPAALT
jgi:hypothetical protein